jgi:UDP:flavonoid glycosyltransferase YjiC (YdhE family)
LWYFYCISVFQVVEEFLDNGTQGVVLFSLGGYMESTILGAANIKLIMSAFAQLKEFRFIWKIDANSTNLRVPKNVLAINWVAQNDVLGKTI